MNHDSIDWIRLSRLVADSDFEAMDAFVDFGQVEGPEALGQESGVGAFLDRQEVHELKPLNVSGGPKLTDGLFDARAKSRRLRTLRGLASVRP